MNINQSDRKQSTKQSLSIYATVSKFCIDCIFQVAIGLNTLKAIGLIHSDLHIGNIMVVDRKAEHLNFKIIDFGLALHKSRASPGMILQPVHFR